jgi:tricorn protease
MNLFVCDLTTEETRKLTSFEEFDIKFPSLGPKAIVFENGGFIYRFDLEKKEAKKVPVSISDDMKSSRGKFVKVGERVTNYEISPDGKRALFGARGEIFTVPAKHGNTRNLTNTSGIHERNSKWSPDAKWIAFISDRSGEDEIYIMLQDGSEAPRQITKGGDTYKYQPYWSPDSRKILWGDKLLRLNYVDIEAKKIVEVARAKIGEIRRYAWSPDSNWITYQKPEAESMSKVYLHNCTTKKPMKPQKGGTLPIHLPLVRMESTSFLYQTEISVLSTAEQNGTMPIHPWAESTWLLFPKT